MKIKNTNTDLKIDYHLVLKSLLVWQEFTKNLNVSSHLNSTNYMIFQSAFPCQSQHKVIAAIKVKNSTTYVTFKEWYVWFQNKR